VGAQVVTTVVSVECGAPVERAAAKSSHPAVQDEVGAVEVFEEEVPVVEAAVWKAEFPAGSTVEGRAEEGRGGRAEKRSRVFNMNLKHDRALLILSALFFRPGIECVFFFYIKNVV
jgi:hypothetical protein